jgi:hypothetical protein
MSATLNDFDKKMLDTHHDEKQMSKDLEACVHEEARVSANTRDDNKV